MPFAPGETFERYAIEALIGRGGMGEVYRAVDTRLRRKVALKVIRPDKDRPDAAARLYREARAAAALSHPNAVAVHDVGEAEGVFFIVMELVVGQPLLAFVGDPRVGVAKKIAWLTDVARAIGAAHRAGIIHRDVKPSNVMVSEDGFAKVLDFGLARPLGPIDPVSFRTQEGRVLGTLRYMAPEQIAGAEADARSDQYAFGLTAYELLAGSHPGGALIDAKPKLADAIAPEVPHEVAVVLDRMIARSPDERYPSMDDVVHALESAIFTQRAPPPYMTPPPLVAASRSAASAETAETLSAVNGELGLALTPSSDDLGAANTLAALANAPSRDAAPPDARDATLVSKEAPSALVRHRDVAVNKTLPLGASAPAVAPRTLVSGTSSPLASAPAPAPGPPASGAQAPPPSRSTTIIVAVAVLAVAAFAGTYLGSRQSAASSAGAPAATVTSSTPPPASSLPTTSATATASAVGTPGSSAPGVSSTPASTPPSTPAATPRPRPHPTGGILTR